MAVSERTTVIKRRAALGAVKDLLDGVAFPSADLTAEHMEHFFYCGTAGRPTGVVGLELFGADAFLRSLVVATEQRSAGLGTALVEHAERYARASGARSLFLLTTTVPDSSRGSATLQRIVWLHRQGSKACSKSRGCAPRARRSW